MKIEKEEKEDLGGLAFELALKYCTGLTEPVREWIAICTVGYGLRTLRVTFFIFSIC